MGTSVKFVKTDALIIAVHVTKLLGNAYIAKTLISCSMDSVGVVHTVVNYVSLPKAVLGAKVVFFYTMDNAKVARMGVEYVLLRTHVNYVRMTFRVPFMIDVFINVLVMV